MAKRIVGGGSVYASAFANLTTRVYDVTFDACGSAVVAVHGWFWEQRVDASYGEYPGSDSVPYVLGTGAAACGLIGFPAPE